MKKKLLVLLIITLLAGNLAGCTNEKATVTTTNYAVKYLVEALAGERVDVEYISTDAFIQRANLVQNYKEILSRTTLFLYIGELEPYIDVYPEIFTNYKFDAINLASLSAIYDFKRYTTVSAGNGVFIVQESEYYDSELFDSVDLYHKDPYIWLDPIAMSSMASTIKDWLCAYYPEDTLVFENNFRALQQNFVRMDAEYQELKKLSNIKIVTVTCSFGNWQKLYGVQVYPLIISKYGALPTDEQLQYIEDTIKDEDVKYIVYDDTLPSDMQKLYEKVKEDLSLETIELSSLSRLSPADIEKNKSYTTKMYENLTNLEKAFKESK